MMELTATARKFAARELARLELLLLSTMVFLARLILAMKLRIRLFMRRIMLYAVTDCIAMGLRFAMWLLDVRAERLLVAERDRFATRGRIRVFLLLYAGTGYLILVSSAMIMILPVRLMIFLAGKLA